MGGLLIDGAFKSHEAVCRISPPQPAAEHGDLRAPTPGRSRRAAGRWPDVDRRARLARPARHRDLEVGRHTAKGGSPSGREQKYRDTTFIGDDTTCRSRAPQRLTGTQLAGPGLPTRRFNRPRSATSGPDQHHQRHANRAASTRSTTGRDGTITSVSSRPLTFTSPNPDGVAPSCTRATSRRRRATGLPYAGASSSCRISYGQPLHANGVFAPSSGSTSRPPATTSSLRLGDSPPRLRLLRLKGDGRRSWRVRWRYYDRSGTHGPSSPEHDGR